MITVGIAVSVLLAAATGLTLWRVVRGPATLDRIIAVDVLLAIIVTTIAALAAFRRDATALPILVVLSVLGFTGTVSVARFAARERT